MSEAEALEDWSDEGMYKDDDDWMPEPSFNERRAKAEYERSQKRKAKRTSKAQPVRGRQIMMLCNCGQRYMARTADLKRGWALSCSKRCAAIRREFGRPAAKPVEG